ncbi:hypothetical protein AAW51_5158 [Caldimonas brevitalea]|uniref:Thioredoxin domain-containing protein n=2 Tax=Caldimonas brevitalea TaxID=413882 RepID=A0A0G3BR02_9BURK|nr:hypothetical protein AAW51_5158 [Caldimonas brevitalea]
MAAPLLQLGLAAGAGVATVASPCVLPMLPMLLGGSIGQADRLRPLLIVAGFVLSFATLALVFGASAQALGVSAASVRQAAAVVMLLAGLLMLWPALGDRLSVSLQPLGQWGHRVAGIATGRRLGAFLLGAALGALWAPCAGPVLASILALIAQARPGEAAPLLAAFAVGAAAPMLAIGYGGQAASLRMRAMARHTGRLRRAFGLAVVAVAVAMLAKVDTQVVAALSRWVSAGAAAAVQPEADGPVPVGAPAPDFAGITHWLNSPPLTMSQLRGRVVLVDFWTYGCVNCVRTLPHVRRWHERYAADGLVVVGVHTPEFGHERPLQNVQAAVQRHGLRYPVAQDNGYATWSAYRNVYWPALYLVDRDGRIVFRHFGEGDEAQVEQRLRQALGLAPS